MIMKTYQEELYADFMAGKPPITTMDKILYEVFEDINAKIQSKFGSIPQIDFAVPITDYEARIHG